jgi:outer membrane lipoprotein-sorting protein
MTTDDERLQALYPDLLAGDGVERRALIAALDAAYTVEPPHSLATLSTTKLAALAEQTAPAPAAHPWRIRLHRRPVLTGLGIAAAIVAAAGIAIATGGHTAAVNAETILQKAQTATGGTPAGGVSSYHLEVTGRSQAGSMKSSSSSQVWSAGPDRLHIDSETSASEGEPAASQRQSMIVDGERLWLVGTQAGTTTATSLKITPGAFLNQFSPVGGSVDAVLAALNDGNGCSSVQRRADATVAGRAVYVLSVTDNGPNCRVATGGSRSGGMVVSCGGKAGVSTGPAAAGSPPPALHQTLWIDKQTFVPLKQETSSGEVVSSYEVTRVEYNLAIPDATFSYTPPADADVADGGTLPPNAMVGQGLGGMLMVNRANGHAHGDGGGSVGVVVAGFGTADPGAPPPGPPLGTPPVPVPGVFGRTGPCTPSPEPGHAGP